MTRVRSVAWLAAARRTLSRARRPANPLLPPRLRRPGRAGRDASPLSRADGLPGVRGIQRREHHRGGTAPPRWDDPAPHRRPQLRRRLPRRRRERPRRARRARLSGHGVRRDRRHGRKVHVRLVPPTAAAAELGADRRARPRRHARVRGPLDLAPQSAALSTTTARVPRSGARRPSSKTDLDGESPPSRIRPVCSGSANAGSSRRPGSAPPSRASRASTTRTRIALRFAAGRSTRAIACSTSAPSSEAVTTRPCRLRGTYRRLRYGEGAAHPRLTSSRR